MLPRAMQTHAFVPEMQAEVERHFEVTLSPTLANPERIAFAALLIVGPHDLRIDDAVLDQHPAARVVANFGVG